MGASHIQTAARLRAVDGWRGAAPSSPETVHDTIPPRMVRSTAASRKDLSRSRGTATASLRALSGVRLEDMMAERRRRDRPRGVFAVSHAVLAIVVLVAALAASMTLLVQQSVNLAALTSSRNDAAMIKVDLVRPASPPSAASPVENDTGLGANVQTDLINLNTATETQLQSITGVGPVTAQRIIAYRGVIGRFTSVEQLLEIKGIGPKTLDKIREEVTV